MQAFVPTHTERASEGWIELVTSWAWVLVRADGETAAARSSRSEALSQAVMRFLDRAPQPAGQCFLAVEGQGSRVLTWWPSEDGWRRFKTEWIACLAAQDDAATLVVDLLGEPGTVCRELACSPITQSSVPRPAQVA